MSRISKALIGGNWKCNGTHKSVHEYVQLLNKSGPFSPNSEVVLAVPHVHLQFLKDVIRDDINVCAEDVAYKRGFGAYTGEVSAEMLLDLGIKWTLTGHSERRLGFGFPGETNEVVAAKTKNALEVGMNVILCIGEQLEDRQQNRTMDVCIGQLKAVKDVIPLDHWKNVVIAYEPVWAIGTGVTATPAQAQETHLNIRSWLKDNLNQDIASTTRIIYGGSANSKNCKDLFSMEDIDGFLVGGASLKPEFVDIINCTKDTLKFQH